MIRVFDAFSGIGGFRSAFERVGGFEMVGWCEIDKFAQKSYRAMDAEFAKLFEEETQLSQKLLSLKTQCKVSDDTKEKIDSTLAEIENSRFQLEAFDDVLIRKLIECIKVLSKTEILIIFKGGYEVKTEVEKK